MTVRNWQSIFAVALILMFVSGLPAGLSARTAYAETNIAVVDVDSILASSKAAKSVKSQVDSKRKSFLKDVKEQEDKLRTEQKNIEKKRSEMSKEELMKKAQEFEARRTDARNTLKKKKAALDKSYSKAMNKLTKTITEVCQEIADEKKIDLIITRQNIIIGSKSLDITQEVMAKMNKKLPTLSLD